jgi:hypothetical protein
MLNVSQARKVYVIRLSEVADQKEILHPELLALALDHRVSPLDVGVYAYSVRTQSTRQGKYLVDPGSVIPSRRKLILGLLEAWYVAGTSHKTIETNFQFLGSALNWCDVNGHSDVFCNPEAARSAYMEYSNFIYQEILKPNGMAPLTGQLRQGMLRRSLQLQFPESSENIISSVPPIKAQREGLDPPEDEDVKRYIDITLNIALSFSRFLVDEAPFPVRFKTNEYQTHIFPGHGKYITPYTRGKHEFSAYNYEEGRILTIDELRAASPEGSIHDQRLTLARAENLIVEANADPYHPFRMRLATLAMNAYACLLNMVIGANSGELVQFLYDDAVALVKSPLKNELSAIKLRAKGLEVTYSLGRGPGMQILREYLKFRDWLLNGRECEYLFCQVLGTQYVQKEPTPLEVKFSGKYFARIVGVFIPNGAKNIPPLLVRKFKSLTLHQLKHSPLLVGAVLNHSEKTNLQSYAGITTANQKSEFGNYWAAIKKAAQRIKESGSVLGTSIAVGHCDSIDSPEKDIPVVAIEPDCKTQYGCLFCVHYVVHSDEADIHKLLSFLYVIEGVRASAPSFEYSEEVFKDVVIRIDFILEAISKRSLEAENLIISMKNKVFNLGILTPFWERRLQRYEKMGIYI